MTSFSFTYEDLGGLYRFSLMMEAAFDKIKSETLECQRDLKSRDCFSPRFNGYRVYARNPKHGRNMYLWCGILYDYRGRSGMMVEMDAFSNQDIYADALAGLKADSAYEILSNERHVKLFMPESDWEAMCALPDPRSQEAFLLKYLSACMEAFSAALSV